MPLFLVLAAAAAVTAASPEAAAGGGAAGGVAVSPKAVDVPAVANGAPPMKQDLAGDPEQMICKRVVTTGTRFATKDCRTRAEWNQLAVDSHQATMDMTSRQNGFSN